MRKLFGGWHISWPQVLVFAACAGVYTGLINQLPAVADTSLTDIVVTYECWVLFAAIVALNCETVLEAALKTFVFFAISQPLVFAVELPVIGFAAARSYLASWLVPIALTLPGGAVAWLMGRNRWYSSLIAAVGVAFLGMLAATHLLSCLANPPRHLLSALFCVALAAVFVALFVRPAAAKAVVGVLGIVALAGTLFVGAQRSVEVTTEIPEGTWQVLLQNEDGVSVTASDGTLTYECSGIGLSSNIITLTNDEGETLVFDFSVDASGAAQLVERE